ncbi:MAG: M15 family metallopeptidase [Myxococcales bacterium]|nr:M15 family metallopeptidase [Myxococcales bacterium]MBL0198360.1 M15 family metallopeptidase [Myxococcales bacterium]
MLAFGPTASPALDVLWDDGRAKTFDEKLAAPDVEDILSIPYRRGSIVPVTGVNDDPGRIRHDGVLKAIYGQTEALVRAELVNVSFMGQSLPFHRKAAPALTRVAQRLATAVAQTPSLGQYVTGELGGTMTWRFIANTTRLSSHSFATAIDIVVAKSNYWEWEKDTQGRFTWKNSIPQAIVDIFESEGFAWGGRWYHYDTMHFEYRPELFDPACVP